MKNLIQMDVLVVLQFQEAPICISYYIAEDGTKPQSFETEQGTESHVYVHES